MDKAREAPWGPFYEAETIPAATTERGAVEALRQVIAEDAFLDDFTERLARAALAFFDGRA